jgi:hypothetical protein
MNKINKININNKQVIVSVTKNKNFVTYNLYFLLFYYNKHKILKLVNFHF